MSASTKRDSAYAHAALAWVLGTLTFASTALFQASDPGARPTRLVLGGLLLTMGAFGVGLVTGYRVRFKLGTDAISHKLRRLSGAVAAASFVWGWGGCAVAYAGGGPLGVHSLLRHSMPSTAGIALGVIGATAGCLFLYESTSAVFELRGGRSPKAVAAASLLSLVAAAACIAALSGVIVGRVYFFGAS